MATILKGCEMEKKSKIENILTEAYNHNSFEYLGLCDGGNDGQVVYVQVYAKYYIFYG